MVLAVLLAEGAQHAVEPGARLRGRCGVNDDSFFDADYDRRASKNNGSAVGSRRGGSGRSFLAHGGAWRPVGRPGGAARLVGRARVTVE
jgi:hypothetical protein